MFNTKDRQSVNSTLSTLAVSLGMLAMALPVSAETGIGTEEGTTKEKESSSLETSSGQNETPPQWSPAGGPLVLSKPMGRSGLTWLSTETTFTVDEVLCNGTNIGRLDFLYRPWYHATSSGDYAGASLEGGYTASGNDPCEPDGYKTGTEFKWIQMIYTDAPLGGNNADEYYMDVASSTNPKDKPWYPYSSNDDNPSGNPFTAGFYDGPSRREPATGTLFWNGTNMLVCTNSGKINVIGSFLWGFHITADGDQNNGSVDNFGFTPHSWGNPPGPGLISILADHLKGTATRKGWAVSTGCCCPKPLSTDATSTVGGASTFVIEVPEGESLEGLVIFPRNHVIDWELAWNIPGWYPESSEHIGVPRLPYQEEPSEMLQDGIYLWPEQSIHGPESLEVTIPISGHESFFDVYFMDSGFEWNPWVQRTDHLLGDMNGDGQHDEIDIDLLQLAIIDVDTYTAEYPWINPVFAGDLGHDGALSIHDVAMLAVLVNDVTTESDATDLETCASDINGDGMVAVDDLLRIIGAWGPCPGCVEDLNTDGRVDVMDLIRILADWGSCVEE